MATIDTTKPALTDTYTTILTTLRDQLAAQRRMFDGDTFSGTTPTGAIRYSAANSRLEKYNGTAWVELTVMTDAVLLTKLKNVDGASSGLDADLLDGQQGSYYTNITARLGYTPLNSTSYTAADVLAKLLTVDGASSGLDADLLDGQQGSYYSPVSGVNSVARRIIVNDGTNSMTQDGLYIGYGNANSGNTRIYGGGSTTNAVTIDGSGNVTATGNVTAYSDLRLKDNLQLMKNPLERVKQLAGFTFDRVDTGVRQAGLIAQDVEKVLPEAIVKAENGMLSVSYNGVVGLLVNAVNELRTRVEALEAA